MRKTKVLIFVLFLAVFGLFFSGLNVKATVATSELISVKGAQVRLTGDNGIKFVGTVSDEYTANVTEYGIAIAFGEATAEQVVLGETVNGQSVLTATTQAKDENDQFYISLIQVPEDMYGQKVTARAYVKNGEEVTYGTEVAIRSLGQVALSAKNAGETGTTLEAVVTTLSTNYMKKYVVGDYTFINDSIYEYEPTAFAKYFIEDWNTVMGTSISTLKGFANTYKDTANETATKAVVVANEFYQFFNANNQEMLTKWGWILEYIKVKAVNEFSAAQINLVKTAEANLAESNTNWYGMQHLLSRFESFMTRGSVTTGLSYQSSTFYKDPSLYLDLAAEMKSLNVKMYTTVDCDFVKIGSNTSLGSIKQKNGYEAKWTNGNDLYESESLIKVSNTIDCLYPKYTPVQYTVKYYNGSTEITSFDTQYTTYNIESNLVLPEYTEAGVFVGWCENSDLSDTPVTEISKGSIGNKVYYLKTLDTNVELSSGDKAALDAVTPTFVVHSAFKEGTWTVNSKDYVYGTTAFSSIADALAKAEEGCKIYVFAGTYADALTIEDANVTIYGPNYNVKGTASRENEAAISNVISINASGVTINGIKLASGSNIAIGSNNTTLTNIYSVSSNFATVTGCNRTAILYTTAAVSDVVVSNSYFNAGNAGGCQGIFASYQKLTNVTFENNYFTHTATVQDVINEPIMTYSVAGEFNVINNDFVWITDNWNLVIGNDTNACTLINIIDNTFDVSSISDNAYYTCGIACRRLTAGSVANIIHNTFGKLSGTIISCRYSVAGSVYNIKYNAYLETAYRQDKYAAGNANLGAGTRNFEGNYYGLPLPTGYEHATDYGVITSVAALETAYAAYKAAN